MPLSVETARKLVDIVNKDLESRRRINSWLRWFAATQYGHGPSNAGLAGAIRNLGMATIGMDPSERDSNAYRWSCDGIAEATAIAINKAIALDPKRFSDIKSAEEQARKEGYSHTGTLVNLAGGFRYVFDWWKSLDAANPHIFRYDDFMYDRGRSVPYREFTGFSD